MRKNLALLICAALLIPAINLYANADDDEELLSDFNDTPLNLELPEKPESLEKPKTQTKNHLKNNQKKLSQLNKSRLNYIFPVVVMHGEAPTGDVNELMPRRVDDGARFVLTPGLGIEYEGERSLDFVLAIVKDCYDDYAGTIQIGQYFKLGSRTKFGYTAGLYIRETPITCYTTSATYNDYSPSASRPSNMNRPPSSGVNTFTTTQCVFNDNLPLRYTFETSGSYVDVIPSPFLNFSTIIYKSDFEITLKLMTNYYLNELGISFYF